MGWLVLFSLPCLGEPDATPTAPTPAPRPVLPTTIKPPIAAPRAVPTPTNRIARLPAGPGTQPTSQAGPAGIFIFDSTNKHVDLVEGERTAAFVFSVTNISPNEVTISYINTSCGCTAGKLPAYPWKLPPGEGGHIDVSMDLTGKFGVITKTATVVSSVGSYVLTVSATLPHATTSTAASKGAMGDRSRNVQVASADRQAIFRNDCASCHVQPTLGKSGRELYETACGICHEAEHRATMVPDLRTRLKNTDRNYWAKWISDGRAGSLMPAFSARQGGILSEQQITSLVDYLEDDYKKNPPASKTVTQAAATPTTTGPATPSPTAAPR